MMSTSSHLAWSGYAERTINFATHLIDEDVSSRFLFHPAGSKPMVHDSPFTSTPQGGVECDEFKMEIGRPYPFQVGGIWFLAVRHGEDAGSSVVYEIPDGT